MISKLRRTHRRLGALRQSYRALRYAITQNTPLAWNFSAHRDYTAFKVLQTRVAAMVAQGQAPRPTPADAARNFAKATANKYEQDWPGVAVRILSCTFQTERSSLNP